MSCVQPSNAKEVNKPINSLLAVPVRYRMPFTRIENGPEWQRTEIVATKFDGDKPSAWAIRELEMVLAKDGEWEYEPSPSERNEEFITRTRFPTAEEAAEHVIKYFPNYPL